MELRLQWDFIEITKLVVHDELKIKEKMMENTAAVGMNKNKI